MNDLMIDLETMGRTPGCAPIAIGAVFFDLASGETGERFYRKIHLQSCLDAGLSVDASTLMWWVEQSDAAKQAWIPTDEDPAYSLNDVVIAFYDWAKRARPDTKITPWGNGATFDLSIWRAAASAVQLHSPWHYTSERDVRTLVDIAQRRGMTIDKSKRPPGAHIAIEDCLFQIAYCSAAYNFIGRGNRLR